jgi:AraC-like DNA-binding protein
VSIVDHVDRAQARLRPEWVVALARALVDGGLARVPPPLAELEHRVLDALRESLAAPDRPAPRSCAERVRRILDHEYRRCWTLPALARVVGCNRTTLQEEFRRTARTSVHRYLVLRRVRAAQRLLELSDLKVSCLAAEVGFRSPRALARHFKRVTGVTPAAYRLRSNHTPTADSPHEPAEPTPSRA